MDKPNFQIQSSIFSDISDAESVLQYLSGSSKHTDGNELGRFGKVLDEKDLKELVNNGQEN